MRKIARHEFESDKNLFFIVSIGNNRQSKLGWWGQYIIINKTQQVGTTI